MVRRALGAPAAEAEAGGMRRLRRDEGQAIVEYAMLLALVSVVVIAFVIVVGLDEAFTSLVDDIEAAFAS
jgi:Flp pilus assembly pilin Flp